LIANYEDVELGEIDRRLWLPRKPTHKVLVTRSTLNLVASRLAKMKGRTDSRLMPINERFFEVLLSHRHAPADWVVVHFDEWLVERDGYRAEIAHRLGLKSDISPDVSHFGGGSSFSGMEVIPKDEDLTTRYQQISWPLAVVERLLEPRYRALLTDDEQAFLRARIG
jgi:hypothetical protein